MLALATTVLAPLAAHAAPDALRGRLKAEAERCQECHGTTGQGNTLDPTNTAARLAGQYPDYIVKQIRDFQTGARSHVVMNNVARHLDDADLADIAAYFASQPAMRTERAAPRASEAPALFVSGDAERDIAACASCHGAAASERGGRAPTPLIEGQDPDYLTRQLRAWRAGGRSNSDGGVMNRVARRLSDQDIEALSGYLSGLQPPNPSRSPAP